MQCFSTITEHSDCFLLQASVNQSDTHSCKHFFLYLGILSNICTQTDGSGATQGSMSCQRIHQHAEWGIQAINLPVDRQPTLLPDLLSHSLLFEENFAKKNMITTWCVHFFSLFTKSQYPLRGSAESMMTKLITYSGRVLILMDTLLSAF